MTHRPSYSTSEVKASSKFVCYAHSSLVDTSLSRTGDI